MENVSLVTVVVLLADLVIRIGLSVRVIMRRQTVGTSLAWLMVVLIFPFFGAFIYLLFGELRLGNRRAEWAAKIHAPYQEWLGDLRSRSQVDWSQLGRECESLSRLTEASAGIPAQAGNQLRLIAETDEVFRSLLADVDAARQTCHMEFYIWNLGGAADEVAEALLRAAARGVKCRLLLDAVGSKVFLRSELADRLRRGGVVLQAALPVGLFRMLFSRLDLRLHRKIVVIDGALAYTGSLNLVDPRFFKKEAGVGQWVDAMVRLRGPAVEPLAITFLEDWEMETAEGLHKIDRPGVVRNLPAAGSSAVQVVPSGPLVRGEAIQAILLMAIYAAREELILTTPYFVPDELLLTALISAAARGVDVTIVVPEKVDSTLVRVASQAHKAELLEAGIRVAQFHGGLLHTKSITVDRQISLFGSLNLDPRSLRLNFEITLTIYDQGFTENLRRLQQAYIDRSQVMDPVAWRRRSAVTRFTANVARLLSPLL